MLEPFLQWVLEWLSQRGKVNGHSEEALMNIDYLEAGLLTSVEVIEFITEIEAKFTIQFSDEDFHDQRFATFSGLSRLVFEHSRQSHGSR